MSTVGSNLHTRRPSRQGSPEFASPYVSRTPKLEQGRPFDGRPGEKRRPSGASITAKYRSRRERGDGPVAAWVKSLLVRVVKSPKVLVALALSAVLWGLIALLQSHSAAVVLAKAPVPQAFLPLIRTGGLLVHKISPAYGSRIKSWTELRALEDPNRPLTEAELEARSSHTFHPNGLLLVNPRGRHPIHVLIERAEKRWKEKVAKQSRTLKDAVREYKLRYKRNPPRGFDEWSVAALGISEHRGPANLGSRIAGGSSLKSTTYSFETSTTRSCTTSRPTGLCALRNSSCAKIDTDSGPDPAGNPTILVTVTRSCRIVSTHLRSR